MKNFIVCIVTMFAFSHLMYPASKSRIITVSSSLTPKFKYVDENHIFAKIATQEFDNDTISNTLFNSPLGRARLLKNQAEKRLIATTACKVLKKNCEYICGSVNNNDSDTYDTANLFWHPNTITLLHDINNIRIVASEIAAIEKVFTENDHISPATQKILEATRVRILYLLQTILERDNFSYVTQANPYSLPELFEKTHASWPPQKYHSTVHPTSGYQIITDALEHRKAHKIDDIDMSQYTENWNVTTSYGLNSEDEKS